MIRKIIKVMVFSILSLFILAIFTNSIMLWEIHPKKVAGTTENWIGFYATIIGGLITFFGVLFTIQFNKYENEKRNKDEKQKDEKINNLTKIKFLWEIQVNLNTVCRDLQRLNDFIVKKIRKINEYEIAILVNDKLNGQFFNNGLKPNKEQIYDIFHEVTREYVDKQFNEIQIQLQEFKNIYNDKNLQVKSAEVDWETYEYIISFTEQVYDICDTQKTITSGRSDEIIVFMNESKRISDKINGMFGIIPQILGFLYVIKEKQKDIEKKYFKKNIEILK